MRSETKTARAWWSIVSVLAAGGCTSLRQDDPDATPPGDTRADTKPDTAADVPADVPADAAFDAAPDAAPDGPADVPTVTDVDPGRIAAPRLVAPLATTWMTSGLLTFRWRPVADQGAVLHVCSDARCMRIERAFPVVAGASSLTLTTALTQGNHWWRMVGAVGATEGLTPSPVWHFVVEGRGTRPAFSGGPMIDLDGEGRRDLAVGAPGDMGGNGLVYLWRLNTPIVPNMGFLLGNVELRGAGMGVSPAGDLNGDGLGDLVTASRDGFFADGEVLLTMGWRDGAASGHPVRTNVDDRAFGFAATGVGDLDGDGYGDVAVGQPPVDETGRGRVLVYAGAANGHRGWDGRSLVLSTWNRLGTLDTALYGRALAAAGDLNGDGFDDLVVGAPPRAVTTPGFAGEVDVYYGSATGPAAAPSLRIACPEAPGNFYGSVLAGVGDLNGDGYPDLAIGAPGQGTTTARVYVHHGGPTGLAPTASATLPAPDGVGTFGMAIAGVGDIDQNGFADMAVATAGAGGFSRVYVYRGSATGARATDRLDVNAPEAGVPFARVIGSRGDIDGDGAPDLLVGTSLWNGSTGRVRVFRGVMGGPESVAWRTLDGAAAGARFGEAL